DHGYLHEAIDLYRKAVANKPSFAAAHSGLLYALHHAEYFDEQLIYEEHVAWAKVHAAPLAKEIRPHGNDRSVDRRLRIGCVSADSAEHLKLDPAQAEVICFSDAARTDAE